MTHLTSAFSDGTGTRSLSGLAHRFGEGVLGDLKAKTPFRIDDIFHGHSAPEPAGPGRLSIKQWIIRKRFLDEALADVGLEPADLSFVECAPETHDGASPMRIAIGVDHNT